jgi:hypothetical protein
MKRLVAILICVVIALAVLWGLWANHERDSKTVVSTPPIQMAPGVWPKPPSPSPVSSTSGRETGTGTNGINLSES